MACDPLIDDGFVFPSLNKRGTPGGPWTVPAFRTAWRRELAGTAFTKTSPYICRHSYGTRLRGLIPDEELSRIMGNSSNVLRSTYSHIEPQTIERVKAIISALM